MNWKDKIGICFIWTKRALVLKLLICIVVIIINSKYAGFFDEWIVPNLDIKQENSWKTTVPAEKNTLITSASTNRLTTIKSKFCDSFPEDILLFDKKKNDTSFCCDSCAVVSSSGIMKGSLAGSDIESKECVVRMNNAPTREYENDVGSRTTFRVFAHSSVVDVKNLLRSDKSQENSTVFIAWGPKRNMMPGAVTHNHLKDISRLFPNARIYTYSDDRMIKTDKIFEVETGKNRLSSGAYLSTGWFTLLFAKDVCREIHVYGMVEESFCEKVSMKVLKDAPYHYYKPGSSQCNTYRHHENIPRGGHRFITEKRVFNKWAKEWGNMKFHHPEWDLDS